MRSVSDHGMSDRNESARSPIMSRALSSISDPRRDKASELSDHQVRGQAAED